MTFLINAHLNITTKYSTNITFCFRANPNINNLYGIAIKNLSKLGNNIRYHGGGDFFYTTRQYYLEFLAERYRSKTQLNIKTIHTIHKNYSHVSTESRKLIKKVMYKRVDFLVFSIYMFFICILSFSY